MSNVTAPLPDAGLPVRIFALLLFPAACWQVWLFPAIPNYYAQHFLIYPCGLFMCWAWWRGLWTLREAWRLLRPALPWLAALLLLQGMSGWRSAALHAAPGQALAWLVTRELVKLMVQAPFVFFFVLLCRVLLREAPARRCLLWGAVGSLALLFGLFGVQALYAYGSESADPAMAPLVEGSARLLAGLSPWLEARWPDTVYDFYGKGAYALTELRCNGFFEEASALAAMVSVFFVPLSFGLLALGEQRGERRLLLTGMAALVVCLVMLVFSRSTTGQALAAATLVLAGCSALRGRHRRWKCAASALLACACLYAAVTVPQVSSFLLHRLEALAQASSPRVVTLLDTLDMIKDHPVLGVGRGWYFSHLHQGRHYTQNLQDPELRIWKAKGSGGELSALPALAAQYGVPVVALVLGFVGRTWWLLRRRARQQPEDATLTFMSAAGAVWMVLGLVAALGSLDIRNPLFCLPFFMMYVLAHPEQDRSVPS